MASDKKTKTKPKAESKAQDKKAKAKPEEKKDKAEPQVKSERPPIAELLKRDIELGIKFLNEEENNLLAIESVLKKMAIMIGDKERPTTLPSQAVIRVFMSRNAAKSVKKALTTVGATLGVYSASKRELVDDLRSAEEGLFPNKEFEVDEVTGEIIYKGQESEEAFD